MLNFSKFYNALVTVLQDEIEYYLIEMIKSYEFGLKTKGKLEYRFEEWLVDVIKEEKSLKVITDNLGRKKTEQLLNELNVTLPKGKSLKGVELANLLEKSLKLPNLDIKGRQYYVEALEDLKRTDMAKVASEIRQLCERMLREIILVSLKSEKHFAIMIALKKEKRIRLPENWGDRNKLTSEIVYKLLLDDSSGDLGFFTTLLEESNKYIKCATPNKTNDYYYNGILQSHECKKLIKLSQALHPYIHFKPSFKTTREENMKHSLKDFSEIVSSLAERHVIPEAAVFLEHTKGYFGSYYSGIKEKGQEVIIRSDEIIPLEKRVLFWEISNPVHRISGWASPNWE